MTVFEDADKTNVRHGKPSSLLLLTLPMLTVPAIALPFAGIHHKAYS
jgi:hypothetical protein